MTVVLDPARPIFEEPPDEDLFGRCGVLLLNWNGQSGREAWETARAYRVAAERLLDAALQAGETWESIDPVMFCYRHAAELHLKALIGPEARRTHALGDLIAALRAKLRCFRQSDVDYLCERLLEFDLTDPRSTAFRYTDAVPIGRPPELWLDLHHLSATMSALFGALERVRLHLLESGAEA